MGEKIMSPQGFSFLPFPRTEFGRPTTGIRSHTLGSAVSDPRTHTTNYRPLAEISCGGNKLRGSEQLFCCGTAVLQPPPSKSRDLSGHRQVKCDPCQVTVRSPSGHRQVTCPPVSPTFAGGPPPPAGEGAEIELKFTCFTGWGGVGNSSGQNPLNLPRSF